MYLYLASIERDIQSDHPDQANMINTIVLSLQAADFGERLCGAFNFLPPPELQTHLLGIWKNLTQDPNKEGISPPFWVKDYRIVSDILVHPSMSSVDELMQTGYIGDELSGRSSLPIVWLSSLDWSLLQNTAESSLMNPGSMPRSNWPLFPVEVHLGT